VPSQTADVANICATSRATGHDVRRATALTS